MFKEIKNYFTNKDDDFKVVQYVNDNWYFEEEAQKIFYSGNPPDPKEVVDYIIEELDYHQSKVEGYIAALEKIGNKGFDSMLIRD